jgi:hypothetical protein
MRAGRWYCRGASGSVESVSQICRRYMGFECLHEAEAERLHPSLDQLWQHI